jgi:antitoxin HicB
MESRSPIMLYKIPLIIEPQPEGGYTITSPLLPELITEGDTADEALENVRDALSAVVEMYKELGRPLPTGTQLPDISASVCLETLVATP